MNAAVATTPKNTRRTAVVRICLAAALAVTLCLTVTTPALARITYCIDPSHPHASNQNPGTEERPFRTIESLRDRIAPGDVVMVKVDDEWLRFVYSSSSGGGAAELLPDGKLLGRSIPPVAARALSGIRRNLPLVALAAAFLLHMFLLLPLWRRWRYLGRAVKIIDAGDMDRLKEAEQLLRKAVTVGLWRNDLATARFALAYTQAQRGRLTEAKTVLFELLDSGDTSVETVYLKLWSHSKDGESESVIETFEEHGEELDDFLQTKLIAGIAYLTVARRLWSRRQGDQAIRHYDRLRELGVLSDQIPADIRNQRVMFAIAALYDRSVTDARKHLDAAVEWAKQHGAPSESPRIGLLLCDWLEGDQSDIESELGDILNRMDSSKPLTIRCAKCDHEQTVDAEYLGKVIICQSCGEESAVDEKTVVASAVPPESASADGLDGSEPVSLDNRTRLRRNAGLWHALLLPIMTWSRFPACGGLPDGERDKLERRLDGVRLADSSMSDPDFIAGLIDYYFARDEEARKAAIETLELARKKGVSLPELLVLLDDFRQAEERREDTFVVFLVMLRSYADDETVPVKYRRAAAEMLKKYEKTVASNREPDVN